LTSLCSKTNWDDVNQSLINKGWAFYDSKKGDSEHYDIITWSYDKEYYGDKASGWFYLYTYEGIPSMVRYAVFNETSYKLINNSLKSSGFVFKKNEVLDNEVTSYYESNSYYIEISNIKRKGSNYYDEASTAYSFTAKKKGGVYDPDNGVKYEYYYGSSVKTEYNLKNGKLNGSYKSYHLNGRLEAQIIFQNGEKNGDCKVYYDNGILKKTVTFLNDKEDGKCTMYDLYGNVESVVYYKLGELNGSAKEYKNGLLDNETEYVMGKANGIHKEYLYDGTKISFMSSCNYLNGERHGTEIVFINGEKGLDTLEFTNYSEGVKHGTFREFKIDTIINGTYYNGKLSGFYSRKVNYHYVIDNEDVNSWFKESEGYYSEGKKNGTWKFFLRGIPFNVGQYQNDQQTGLWTRTVPLGPHEGELWGRTNYMNGLLNGKDELYYVYNSEDGTFTKCSIISNYRNGKLNGEYIFADSTGFVYEKGSYVDDLKAGNWIEINNIDAGDRIIQIQQEGVYISDNKHGMWSTKINGELKSKLTYYKGKLNGQALYYDNDIVWKEGSFDDDHFEQLIYFSNYPTDTIEVLRSGTIMSYYFDVTRTLYFPDSLVAHTFRINASIDTINEHSLVTTLESGGNYTLLNGNYSTINKQRQILRKGTYSNGMLEGEQYVYDYEANVYIKSTYYYNSLMNQQFLEFDDKLFSGTYKLFDKNHKIVSKIKVTKGKRNGLTLYYDAGGKVSRKEKYKDGILVN